MRMGNIQVSQLSQAHQARAAVGAPARRRGAAELMFIRCNEVGMTGKRERASPLPPTYCPPHLQPCTPWCARATRAPRRATWRISPPRLPRRSRATRAWRSAWWVRSSSQSQLVSQPAVCAAPAAPFLPFGLAELGVFSGGHAVASVACGNAPHNSKHVVRLRVACERAALSTRTKPVQAGTFARLVAPDAGMLATTLGMAQRAAELAPNDADYVRELGRGLRSVRRGFDDTPHRMGCVGGRLGEGELRGDGRLMLLRRHADTAATGAT
jgi:hypothetical protein